MVDYILGNYLVEVGKISKAQLQDVLQKRDSVRARLGLIAVSEGFMTREEAEEINRLQSVMDQRFGDIAVGKGYLTPEQVAMLLKKQGSAYLTFVQTLVEQKLVAVEEWEWLLEEFKRENGYGSRELEDLKSDDADRILPLLLPEEAQKYRKLIGIVIRTMIRLIDRHVYVGRAAMVEDLFPTDGLVKQRLTGESGMMSCLAERDGGLLQVCSVFGREDFSRLDVDALDAAGELLNCISGLYASNVSRKGCQMELAPPEYQAGTGGVRRGSICRIPVFIGNKGFYFAVGELE